MDIYALTVSTGPGGENPFIATRTMSARRPAQPWALTPWPDDTCSIGGACPYKELQIDTAPGWALQVSGHPLNPALAWLSLAWLQLWGGMLLVFLILQENSTLAQARPAKRRDSGDHKTKLEQYPGQSRNHTKWKMARRGPCLWCFIIVTCSWAKNEWKWQRDRRTAPRDRGRIQGVLLRGEI